MEFPGGAALVTGGGSGIGQATARALAEAGIRVCVVDVNGDHAKAVADEVGGIAVVADVSDSAQIDAAFTSCIEAFGGVDLVHLNAGTSGQRDIGSLTDEAYIRIRGVNLDGVIYGTRAAVRAFRERTDGRTGGVIIVTASVAGIDPTGAPDPIYVATKHGAVGFVRAVAPPLAQEGIAIHAICPDLTDTAIMPDQAKAMFVKMGIAMMPPSQVADVVLAAATADLELSGTCWVVDAESTRAHHFNDVDSPFARAMRGR
jgi:NAD(P)-dependent dehydrogenase (short-subunit alcohol dehydrogenase family)